MTSSGGWPALDYEDQEWRPTPAFGAPAGGLARRQRYRSAIPPFIATVPLDIDPESVNAAVKAGAELSRLDAELGPLMLNYGPILLRSEAASSSQIENLTASARSIFSAEAGLKTGRNAQMIAANTRAMQAAVRLSGQIDPQSILDMHSALMQDQPSQTPGVFREEAVWSGTRWDSPLGAEFVAPHHQRIPALIEDLVQFAGRQESAPLVAVALAHAQFETIHPFTDGNGRTGRALAQAMLRNHGVLRNVAIPVSAGLLADVSGYHHALGEYRSGRPEPIIDAFSEASTRAIANTRQMLGELIALRESWNARLTARRDAGVWALLDVAIRQPVFSAATAAEEVGVQVTNVYRLLDALVKADILQSKHEHRAGPVWRADEVLQILDRFAERAGRRTVPL